MLGVKKIDSTVNDAVSNKGLSFMVFTSVTHYFNWSAFQCYSIKLNYV